MSKLVFFAAWWLSKPMKLVLSTTWAFRGLTKTKDFVVIHLTLQSYFQHVSNPHGKNNLNILEIIRIFNLKEKERKTKKVCAILCRSKDLWVSVMSVMCCQDLWTKFTDKSTKGIEWITSQSKSCNWHSWIASPSECNSG